MTKQHKICPLRKPHFSRSWDMSFSFHLLQTIKHTATFLRMNTGNIPICSESGASLYWNLHLSLWKFLTSFPNQKKIAKLVKHLSMRLATTSWRKHSLQVIIGEVIEVFMFSCQTTVIVVARILQIVWCLRNLALVVNWVCISWSLVCSPGCKFHIVHYRCEITYCTIIINIQWIARGMVYTGNLLWAWNIQISVATPRKRKSSGILVRTQITEIGVQGVQKVPDTL